jgi:hypothetical protein
VAGSNCNIRKDHLMGDKGGKKDKAKNKKQKARMQEEKVKTKQNKQPTNTPGKD